jgi:hypothetical protein
MSAVLAALWSFANSTAGQTAIISIAAWVFGKAVKGKDRREQILGIAKRAFDVVEILGLRDKLDSKVKWTKFVELVVDGMRQQGLGELSGAEMAMLKALATDKAVIAKRK